MKANAHSHGPVNPLVPETGRLSQHWPRSGLPSAKVENVLAFTFNVKGMAQI